MMNGTVRQWPTFSGYSNGSGSRDGENAASVTDSPISEGPLKLDATLVAQEISRANKHLMVDLTRYDSIERICKQLNAHEQNAIVSDESKNATKPETTMENAVEQLEPGSSGSKKSNASNKFLKRTRETPETTTPSKKARRSLHFVDTPERPTKKQSTQNCDDSKHTSSEDGSSPTAASAPELNAWKDSAYNKTMVNMMKSIEVFECLFKAKMELQNQLTAAKNDSKAAKTKYKDQLKVLKGHIQTLKDQLENLTKENKRILNEKHQELREAVHAAKEQCEKEYAKRSKEAKLKMCCVSCGTENAQDTFFTSKMDCQKRTR